MTKHPAATAQPGRLLSETASAEFSGITARILMGGDDAPFTVMELTVGSGMGAPAHISFHEDKIFHVSQGRFLFLIGETRIEAGPGAHVFVGKGQVHSFAAQDCAARMTLVSSPAHHDRFFLGLSALPVPHDPAQVEAVCRACDQRIVGPVVGT
ncbi:hypothetical protein CCR90_07885 [Rhodovulum sulfidophilum]|uniref:hypothetical protein n=1 Tax=Rhodovulum sulfidophilum TaxID=35806 RepID=UPI001914D5F9|nr:hypothetical protein [Rhodovulum sulfidophilum]MBK5923706.1 hypothetical protein [Rhodovulum sulfidophilum]